MTSWRGYDLLGILTRCGQRDNLKLCLDAGDANSYTSGQRWLDRSGNGYDFFLGADGSATGTDPTFNGTAGRLSDGEYFGFDGGDYFTYDSANETWMNNIHKDNAKFTIIAALRTPNTGGSSGIIGCGAATTEHGFAYFLNTAETPVLQVFNGSGSLALSANTGQILTADAWSIIGISVDEGATTGIYMLNGAAGTFTSTYTSPSSSAASRTMEIGACGTAALPMQNTCRMAALAMWEGRSLSSGELQALHMALRGRFGI